MSQVPQIDPSKVEVKITKVGETDHQLDVEVPATIVTQFLENLKTSGVKLDARMAHDLMRQFCIQESISRMGGEPFYGPAPLPGALKQPVQSGQPFRLSFLCDVWPQVDWPDYSAFSIIRPVREVSEEMVDAELMHQCLDAGEHSTYDGPLEVLDLIEASLQFLDGEHGNVFLVLEEVSFRIPPVDTSVHVGGLHWSGFSKALVGNTVGDTVTFETFVPRGFPVDSLEGAPATAEIDIKQAWRTSPATLERVLEQYGTPNEVILRQQIRLSLQHRAENDQLEALKKQLFDALLDSVEIPIPTRAIERQVQWMVDAIKKQKEEAGQSPEEVEAFLLEKKDELNQEARRIMKTAAIVRLLAKELQVHVTESNVQDRIGILAAKMGRRPEDLRQELMDQNQIRHLYDDILSNMLTQKLLELVTVTDMNADEWNKAGARTRDSGE